MLPCLAIYAAQSCGDVERRGGIADCKTVLVLVLNFDARGKLSLYWITFEDLRAGSFLKSVGQSNLVHQIDLVLMFDKFFIQMTDPHDIFS